MGAKKSTILVVLIAGIAASLSFISYEYSIIYTTQMLDVAAHESRSNAELQAHDLSKVLQKEVESVSNNLETMAFTTAIQNQDVEGAIPLLDEAKKSTADVTSAYSWLDKDGKLLWATSFSSNKTLEQQYKGADFSYRDAYAKPRATLMPYYTTVVEGLDKVQRLQIGYPIIGSADGNDTFKGVVIAAIDIDTLGRLVQSQLLTSYKNTAGLLDRNGVILYSNNATYIGDNIFSPEVQSIIPADIKGPFNQFISDSLKGNTGAGDLTSNCVTTTIAYEPVRIRGNDFAILYIVAPHQLAGSAVALLEQQRILNLIIILAIGATSVGVAALVMTWNRRLTNTVADRTSELTELNKQLAQANEQLKVHDRLQREFINIAAHELRTPTQPLVACAELIEGQFQGKDKIEVSKPEIEMILRNAKRLERLSSDILEISRIESGAFHVKKERFSLAYIIVGAVKDAKAQTNYNQGKVAIYYHPDDIFVYADREKITQVITNILTNALKFTEQGTISIATSRDADNRFAVIMVRDTGCGIDPDIMPKIFDKFITKSEKGTGIGLYLSKNIVEAHGGTISGENNRDGPGACFRFTLPLVEKDERHETQSRLVDTNMKK